MTRWQKKVTEVAAAAGEVAGVVTAAVDPLSMAAVGVEAVRLAEAGAVTDHSTVAAVAVADSQ